ncbi:MAG: recombinase family protein [Brevundimonas sp.]|uniref:recombinase family protein n=1 Tax=Brevundimonas sp. TaxID=1871086 RepID=UPI002ABA6159|nr:recombinase family protein [Brevundimonas sp.]MDZ4109239.1 recombinase family protein [Brevundimonas sp.]
MTKLGYARVSTAGQSLDGQKAALEAAGCTVIRAEKVSGGSRAGRDELQTLLDFIRSGDELVVHRIDRLGRRITDVLTIVDELKAKGASLRVLEPALTTADHVTGQIMITALGMAAELERTFLLDRQRAGIERRKEIDRSLPVDRRAYRGKRRTIDPDAILNLRGEGLGPSVIARRLGISRMTVYRALNP